MIKLQTLYRVEEYTKEKWEPWFTTTNLVIAQTQAQQIVELKNRASRVVEIKQSILKEFKNDDSRQVLRNQRIGEV
jgi:hypothetical protein